MSGRTGIGELQRLVGKWADAVVGIGPGETGQQMEHIRKETREIEAHPTDAVEYADVLMILMDAARRNGISADEIVAAGHAKVPTLWARKWQRGPDGVVEHVRDIERQGAAQLEDRT